MAFNKPSVKPVKTDISDMTIYLRTLKKFGKTTLFRDVVMEKFGDPSYGMLAACGPEIGYELISNLNSTHIKTWQDAVDMKKWLISQKGKEHNIKIVCYDVVDELIPMVETEVVRLSNIENPKKPCKSIKGAFGGYNAGPEMAQQMLNKRLAYQFTYYNRDSIPYHPSDRKKIHLFSWRNKLVTQRETLKKSSLTQRYRSILFRMTKSPRAISDELCGYRWRRFIPRHPAINTLV